MKSLPQRLWCLSWLMYFVLLLNLTLGPGKVDTSLLQADKIAHFGAFFLLILAAPWRMNLTGTLAALACTIIVGGGIELAQDCVSTWNRTGDFWDFFADLAGGFFGLGIRVASIRNKTI